MGVFSWCTSDTRKSIPCGSGYAGSPTTVYLLNPFGDPYVEKNYEGYGEFGGRDVYELVVEWNREHLSSDNIPKVYRDAWAPGEEGELYYNAAVERYNGLCAAVKDYASGKSDEYMKETYGKLIGYGDGSDWKRCLGIKLACYDSDHVKLKYPIKIVENPVDYESAEMSPSCPFQGYFYDMDSLASIQNRVNEAFEELDEAKSEYAKTLSAAGSSLDDKIASAKSRVSEPCSDAGAKVKEPEL